MNPMKKLLILCTLALIAGSAFTGCATAGKKTECRATKSCCK
jgi:hypothetical protein